MPLSVHRQSLRLRSLHLHERITQCRRSFSRPPNAPKPRPDIKHIRTSPGLYATNCIQRNYPNQADHSWRILELHNALEKRQSETLDLRTRRNTINKELKQCTQSERRDALLQEAKELKNTLTGYEEFEKATQEEMEMLALELPNLSSLESPVGEKPEVKGYINGQSKPEKKGYSHVDIGKELDVIDFRASAETSGWGWYFLKREGALLEQALIQYALHVAMKYGWTVESPPSLVYSHIASACGFMPRDQNGETQIYSLSSTDSDKPGMVLTGTAEIPFAASRAKMMLPEPDFPVKIVGSSRCYRAEAGARGVDTKGLYRVHEFTKVEMFAWTRPDSAEAGDRFSGYDEQSQADEIFNELLEIQTKILTDLGLHARMLEMPTTELGASATRKIDIEVYFPSRTDIDGGYGEVSSASMCTDFQTRRLDTRMKCQDKTQFPWTMNGTALAVPRIIAAILENGWDEQRRAVAIPKCLQTLIPGGMQFIARE